MASFNTNQLVELFNQIGSDPIKVGSHIKLYDKQAGSVSQLTLCKPGEANPTAGQISCYSVLGKKLLGATVGETISVNFFNRTMRFKIISNSPAAAYKGGD